MLSKLISRFFRASEPPEGTHRAFETWSIGGIHFDQGGLIAGTATDSAMTWTSDGASIELTTSHTRQDLNSNDVARLRDEQRRLASANGRGLVSAEIAVNQQSISVLEVITKKTRGLGFDYVGSATLNHASGSFVVRMIADEGGLTGIREATVSMQLWELGRLNLPLNGGSGRSQAMEGWHVDPYDSACDDGAVNAVTDDERLDMAFPKHPLSRVRAFLSMLRETVVLENVTPGTPGAPEAPHVVTSGPRRLLPDVCVREVQWKLGCFDAIATSLEEHVDSATDGGGNPAIAESLLMLGIVRARQARYTKAVPALSKALTTFQMLYGSDHVKTAAAKAHLARSFLELGRLDKSEALFLEAFPVLERERPNHLVLGMTLSGYGRLLLARNSAEARGFVMRSKTIVDSLGGGQRLFLLQEAAGEPAPAVVGKIVVVNPS